MHVIIALILGLVVGGVGVGAAVNTNDEMELGSNFTAPTWFLNSDSQLQTVGSAWGVRIPDLVSCDTIDTDANGVMSCGTDAGGVSGSGDSVSIDGGAVVDPDFVSTGDIDFVDTSNTITANINAGSIIETDLDSDVAPADGDFLQYDSTGTNFTWRSASELISDIGLGNVENTALSTWAGTSNITTLGTIGTGVWQGTALTDAYVSDTLTIGGSGSVADGALSANVSLLGSTIAPTELASTDFGDFTCNGTTCSLDASYLTGNETITLSGDVTGSGATSITTALAAGSVADNEINYSAVTLNDFTFDVGSVSKTEYGYLNGVTSALQTQLNAKLESVDISDDTNLTAGAGLTLTGDELSNDFGTSIESSEITDNTITHADIADSDHTSTMCVYIEDPVDTDDLNSLWANKTANDFLITEIWGESDQTVSFDLQVDDGTPADVSGTDIAPAAGEAENTSLAGDTTVAAGEELDLAITSVANTPTWVSICWTGNWVD